MIAFYSTSAAISGAAFDSSLIYQSFKRLTQHWEECSIVLYDSIQTLQYSVTPLVLNFFMHKGKFVMPQAIVA